MHDQVGTGDESDSKHSDKAKDAVQGKDMSRERLIFALSCAAVAQVQTNINLKEEVIRERLNACGVNVPLPITPPFPNEILQALLQHTMKQTPDSVPISGVVATRAMSRVKYQVLVSPALVRQVRSCAALVDFKTPETWYPRESRKAHEKKWYDVPRKYTAGLEAARLHQWTEQCEAADPVCVLCRNARELRIAGVSYDFMFPDSFCLITAIFAINPLSVEWRRVAVDAESSGDLSSVSEQ